MSVLCRVHAFKPSYEVGASMPIKLPAKSKSLLPVSHSSGAVHGLSSLWARLGWAQKWYGNGMVNVDLYSASSQKSLMRCAC